MRDRLLPTYRWTKDGKPSGSEIQLGRQTSNLLLDFLHEHGDVSMPPEGVILPIAAMNVAKRSAAMRQAESDITEGKLFAPPTSLIPTFMVSGHSIAGLEDGYMTNNHPSQELFAYNRLGKKSWLNVRFAQHCLRAVGFAHPNGITTPSVDSMRAKAHSPLAGLKGAEENGLNEWAVISTKSPIACILENGRKAELISRVTGAVDLTSPELRGEETEAITWLANHESLPETNVTYALGQKAILRDAVERLDGSEKNPFHPVLQTVYLTQKP